VYPAEIVIREVQSARSFAVSECLAGVLCRLPLCATCAVLLELLDHPIEIGVTGAKFSREPVAAAFGNFLAVRDHFELSGLTGREDGFHVQVLPDEGHETRDLNLVILSRRAVKDLNLHCVLPSDPCSRAAAQSICRSMDILWEYRNPASSWPRCGIPVFEVSSSAPFGASPHGTPIGYLNISKGLSQTPGRSGPIFLIYESHC